MSFLVKTCLSTFALPATPCLTPAHTTPSCCLSCHVLSHYMHSVLHGCDFDHQKREIYMPLATPTPTAPMQQQQQLPTGQQQQQMGLQASSSAGVYPGMMQQQQQQQYPPPQAPPPEALLLIDYDNTNVGEGGSDSELVVVCTFVGSHSFEMSAVESRIISFTH